MTLKLTWAEHDLTRETALNRDIQLKNHTNLYGVFTWIMWFFQPHGFSMWPFVVANQTDHTCSSLPWPWGTSWNHCPAYLVPSCQTCTQAGPNQPTNQGRPPTATTAQHTGGRAWWHRWRMFPNQIPVTACWLHTWWRILVNAAVDDLMIWCVFFLGYKKGEYNSWRLQVWQQSTGTDCRDQHVGTNWHL